MSWMHTYTGKQVDVEKARLTDINIKDVAHHLSLICRFNGAVRFHYSVAQHSMLCASLVPDEFKLEALLHDAPEAYYGDVIYPIKTKDCYDAVREVHRGFDKVVMARFGLIGRGDPWLGNSPSVREADACLCLAEGEQLLVKGTEGWQMHARYKPAPVMIQETDWRTVERNFIQLFEDLHDC